MAWKEAVYKVSGDSLLQHNIRLANPLDKITKAMKKISAKRKKTDDDHVELARLEFMGGVYYEESTGVFVPSSTWHSALVEASKRQRLGKAFKAGVIVTQDTPLKFDGPKKPEARWKAGLYDQRAVRVTTSRIIRTRPVFHNWSATVTVMYEPEIVDRSQLDDAMQVLGDQIGICDHRPIFGRFTTEVVA
jgi:hypothetical protein